MSAQHQVFSRQALRSLATLDITNFPLTPSLGTGRFPSSSYRYYQCQESKTHWNCQRFYDKPFVITENTFKIPETVPEPFDVVLLSLKLTPFKTIHFTDQA